MSIGNVRTGTGIRSVSRDTSTFRVGGILTILCVALGGCGGGGASKSSSHGTASSTGRTATTSAQPPASQIPPSKEISPGVVRASAQGVTAVMHASTHNPRVNRAWPVSFAVLRNGRPVKAEVRYQYLFAGQVVARRSHYRFTGRFHDIFTWPSSAVGYPLTFRAVIGTAGTTLNLDYPVQVRR
jgi:hypothetical protein